MKDQTQNTAPNTYKKYLKIALHKRYFDTGFGTLNYLKYPLVLLGFAVPDVQGIIITAGVYAVICYSLGWWWLNHGMAEADAEVSNRYNPFVKEMRSKFGEPNNQKI